MILYERFNNEFLLPRYVISTCGYNVCLGEGTKMVPYGFMDSKQLKRNYKIIIEVPDEHTIEKIKANRQDREMIQRLLQSAAKKILFKYPEIFV